MGRTTIIDVILLVANVGLAVVLLSQSAAESAQASAAVQTANE